MKNLAGVKECDDYIRIELAKADIDIVEATEPCGHEVNARLTGKLGEFTFHRAWYYWMVHGKVPLNVAKELYANPNGVTDVRCCGHCGCPPPETEAKRLTLDGKQVISDEEYNKCLIQWQEYDYIINNLTQNYLRESQAPSSELYITSYHIDTQEGLNLFTQKLREHGLV